MGMVISVWGRSGAEGLEKTDRSGEGELAEVGDEVGLIVVAGGKGDVGEAGSGGAGCGGVEEGHGAAEAEDAGEEFGADAGAGEAEAAEVAGAERGVAGKGVEGEIGGFEKGEGAVGGGLGFERAEEGVAEGGHGGGSGSV